VHQLAAAVGEDFLPAAPSVAPAWTTSPRITVVFRHFGFCSVFDTTYFAGAFITSPKDRRGSGSNASACVT
jgi:hypothetical protein